MLLMLQSNNYQPINPLVYFKTNYLFFCPFVITRPKPNGEGVLRYNEPFTLSTLPGVGGEVSIILSLVLCCFRKYPIPLPVRDFARGGRVGWGRGACHTFWRLKKKFCTSQGVYPQKVHSRSFCSQLLPLRLLGQKTMTRDNVTVVQNWQLLGVKTFQATPNKQGLGTSQGFFSKCPTNTPAPFIWKFDSPPSWGFLA